MQEYITLLEAQLADFGVLFIIPFLFLENIPIVGLFAPGITILVLSGFFHEVLVSHPLYLYLVVWLAILLADTFWFTLGYISQQKNRWVRKLVEQSPNVDKLLSTQPFWLLFFYQFIPYFRMFLPFSLGIYKYPIRKWLIITLVSNTLFVATFLSIGVIGSFVVTEALDIEHVTVSINQFLVLGAILYILVLFTQYLRLKK